MNERGVVARLPPFPFVFSSSTFTGPDVTGLLTDQPMTFDLNSPRPSREHYREIRIPKKRLINGHEVVVGTRVLHEPCQELKDAQKTLLNDLTRTCNVRSSNASHAFTRNKDIKTMAGVHVGQRQMVKVDIKDFFPSINSAMVQEAMMLAGYPASLIRRVCHICFLDNSLPQGAPTSPFLSNIVGMQIDRRMVGLCKKWRSFDTRLDILQNPRQYSRSRQRTSRNHQNGQFLRIEPIYYSRYADDLVFSSNYEYLGHLRFAVTRIVQDLGFRVNAKKVTYNRAPGRMVVCGITVNAKVSKPRDTRRGLRAYLHNMIVQRNRGEVNAGQYRTPSGEIKSINFASVAGQVAHVKFVCQSQGESLEALLVLAKQAHNEINSHAQQLTDYLQRRVNGRTEETVATC